MGLGLGGARRGAPLSSEREGGAMVHDIELNLRRLLLRCEQHVEDAARASTTSSSGPPLHTVRGSPLPIPTHPDPR